MTTLGSYPTSAALQDDPKCSRLFFGDQDPLPVAATAALDRRHIARLQRSPACASGVENESATRQQRGAYVLHLNQRKGAARGRPDLHGVAGTFCGWALLFY